MSKALQAAPVMTVLTVGRHKFALPLAEAAAVIASLCGATQVVEHYDRNDRDAPEWREAAPGDWDRADSVNLTVFDGRVTDAATFAAARTAREAAEAA